MFRDTFRDVNLTLNAEEVRRKKLKLRRKVLISLGLFAVIGGLWLAAHPFVVVTRSWQARRHAAKAFALIEQQDWKNAREEALAAYQLRNSEPEALRAVARLLSRTGQTEALNFWLQLRARAHLTRSDLRDEAAIALVAHENERASQAVDQLMTNQEGGPQPFDWLLGARLAEQKLEYDVAGDYVNKVFASNVASDKETLAAVMELQQISNASGGVLNPVVARRLTKLAEGKDSVSLAALTILGRLTVNSAMDSSSDGMDAEAISRALQNHPLAKTEQQLLAIDLQIHEHPDDRDKLVQQAIDQYKSGDETTVEMLAGWLNTHGEYQRELDAIPENRAMQTRMLFSRHIDALQGLNRWGEIRKLIDGEKFPLDPVVEEMYMARCLTEEGQASGARGNWRRAIEAAVGDVSKLMLLGSFAEKNKEFEIAQIAYDAAATISPQLRIAQQGRLRVAWEQGDTQKVHDILGQLLRASPHDRAILNDEAYVRLLMLPSNGGASAELKSIESLATNLMEQAPRSLPHHTLLALTYLREGRPVDALQVYSDVSIPHTGPMSSAMAVHAAALAANHRQTEAKTEASQVQTQFLLPEERALIAGL